MPKEGLSNTDWKRRMKLYAHKEFSFSRGQAPGPTSLWHKTKEDIDKCPAHASTNRKDLFGREIKCLCGYHKSSENVSLPPPLHRKSTFKRSIGVASSSSSSVSSVHHHHYQKSSVTATAITTATLPEISTNTIPQTTPTTVTPPPTSTTITPPPTATTATSPIASTITPPRPSETAEAVETAITETSQPTTPKKSPSKFKRQPIDYSQRLPQEWAKNITKFDRQWIGRHVFSGEKGTHGLLAEPLKLWNYPPSQSKSTNIKPNAESYFARRLFLWMPRRMFSFDFICPECKDHLRSKGVYNRVRLVLDISDYYYLVGEYMHCRCKKTYCSWHQDILNQLPLRYRIKFPAILTHKYAVDKNLIAFLRGRTLGNSPTALKNSVLELHSESWMKKNIDYMEDCATHKRGLLSFSNTSVEYIEAEIFRDIPNARWFLSCYVRDVYTRLDCIKSSITSVFGRVLKIDSTKKILKKLSGEAKNSATWVTNVGNEYGSILQSIVTSSESNESLIPLATGLMRRYKNAAMDPPDILYTDRDCCSFSGPSKFKALFSEWHLLEVRLDIFHFMRRIAIACTSESHPLYGTFMSQLSGCIFEWDHSDYDKLFKAKKNELKISGLKNPSDVAVRSSINSAELARHCRRETRDTREIKSRIEKLILLMGNCTDTLGVPLLKDDVVTIWREQKRHVSCIQDPYGVSLYSKTGEIVKGGVLLPVYRCARGSTSLECFHHHLLNFVPGTSANYVNFQAYLLDGICRWNELRKDPLIGKPLQRVRTFDVELAEKFNSLYIDVHGKPFSQRTRPNKFTGELIGIEYLFNQINENFNADYIEAHIDDGCVPDQEDDAVDFSRENDATFDDDVNLIYNEIDDVDDASADEEQLDTPQSCTDVKGIPGWDKVDQLVSALMESSGISLDDKKATEIVQLYNSLEAYDKAPISYVAVLRKQPKGRFCSRKNSKNAVPGLTQMKRCFVSGATPALSPSKSRVVEAICIYLCEKHPSPTTTPGMYGQKVYNSRWKLIVSDYKILKARITNSKIINDETNLVLFNINETTLRLWFKQKNRLDEVTNLLRGKSLPGHVEVAVNPLPPLRPTPVNLQGDNELLEFPEPEDRSGMAKLSFRKRKSSTSSCTTTSAKAAQQSRQNDNDKISRSLEQPTSISETPPLPPTLPIPSNQPITRIPLPVNQNSTIYRFQVNQPTNISPDGQYFMPSGIPIYRAPFPPKTFQISTMPKTTYYRHLKLQKEGIDISTKARKTYTCRKCKKPMTEQNHKQFKGQRYCPYEENAIPYEQWLNQKRNEDEQKKMNK